MILKDYLGETNFYDKKEKLEINKPKSWLKSVSAFANGRGGKLIFGIKDDNTVIGIENFQKDSEDIREAIKTKMDPIPEFDMEIQEINEKIILILTIFGGKNVLHPKSWTQDWRCSTKLSLKLFQIMQEVLI